MQPAQDPGELFDVFDRDGHPLGVRKARGLVHRDGDWHRSLHLWVAALIDGAPHLVLQRRSAAKDTHPRRLDLAVTGHLRAGEGVEETLREAEEEIGLAVSARDVVRLGLRRRSDASRPGIVDNELQEILALAAPCDAAALRPSPAELEALLFVPLAAAEEVLGRGGEAPGLRLVLEGDAARFVEETVRGAELVPASDGYYAWALAGFLAVLRGTSDPAPRPSPPGPLSR